MIKDLLVHTRTQIGVESYEYRMLLSCILAHHKHMARCCDARALSRTLVALLAGHPGIAAAWQGLFEWLEMR